MHVPPLGDLRELEGLDFVEVEVELDVELEGTVTEDALLQREPLARQLQREYENKTCITF